MEKIILAGIAVWISFIISDGIRPQFSEKHFIYLKANKTTVRTEKPHYVGLTYVIKSMDPH